MTICKVCGRNYKRESCEFCKRIQKWRPTILNQRMEKYLTPRIIRDLKNLSFPPEDHIETESIYLYGKVGTGKTLKAVVIFLQNQEEDYITNNIKTYKFISVPDLLMIIKDCFSSNEMKERDIIKKYSEVDILVLDDFGIEKTTDWSLQTLYLIINYRYEYLKQTIITSNVSLGQLAKKLGDERIPSRLKQMCKIIECKKQYI